MHMGHPEAGRLREQEAVPRENELGRDDNNEGVNGDDDGHVEGDGRDIEAEEGRVDGGNEGVDWENT